MSQVIIGERSAFAVFEPFLADLVTADVEIPDFRRHTLKILCLVDVDALGLFVVGDFIDIIGAGDGIFSNGFIECCRLHEVQEYQLAALLYQRFEKPFIRGERQAREVYLEELGVTGAVGRRVKNSISVVEDILRTKGFL